MASTGSVTCPEAGGPRTFDATLVAQVKAMACELPADSDTPLAKWSCPDLAAEAANRGIVGSVSASTVRRWLASDAIKPAAPLVDLSARP
jgi:Homeodomain-like domain